MEPTIMKQLNFKKIFLNLLWPLLPFTAQAQENNTLYSILSKDSILVPSPSVQNQEEDIVTQMPTGTINTTSAYTVTGVRGKL